MPALTVGTTPAKKVYVGATEAKAVYLGNTLVWQSGPPPWDGWTPAGMTGLVTWLDGAGVEAITTQWPDKSGQGHHGTIVGSPPPAVVANSPTKRKVVRFSAGQGRVRGTIPDLTTDFTIIYVGRMVGPTAGRAFGATLDAGKNYWTGFHTTGLDGWMYGNGAMFRGPTPYGALPSPWRLYTAMAGVTSGTQSSGFWADGALLTSYTGGPVDLGPGTTYNLSGYEATGTGETSDSEVAELLIFNRGLTSAERYQVEWYLAEKWGLTTVWSPKSILGLTCWIDASQQIDSDGVRVTVVKDFSPDKRTFAMTPGQEPVYRTNTSGKPAFEWMSGSGSGLDGGAWDTGPNGLTFFFVGQLTGGSYPMMVVHGPDADGFEMRHSGSAQELVLRYTSHGIVYSHTTPSSGGRDWLWAFRVDSVQSSAWTNRERVNGAKAAMFGTTHPLYVARRQGGYPFVGPMREVLVYAGPLSDADITKVTDYLMTKWAIAP